MTAQSCTAGGEYRLETFKKVVAVPSLDLTGLAWDWEAFSKGAGRGAAGLSSRAPTLCNTALLRAA